MKPVYPIGLEKYSALLNDLKRSLKECKLDPNEPHPDTLILSLYAAGQMKKEEEKHVKAHVIRCDRCYQDLNLLRSMEEPVVNDTLILTIKKMASEIAENTGELISQGSEYIFSTVFSPTPGPAFAGMRLMGPGDRAAIDDKSSQRRIRVKSDFALTRYKFRDGGIFDIRLSNTDGRIEMKSWAYAVDKQGRKRVKPGIYAYLIPKKGKAGAIGPITTDGKAALNVPGLGAYSIELRKKDNSLAGVVDLKIR